MFIFAKFSLKKYASYFTFFESFIFAKQFAKYERKCSHFFVKSFFRCKPATFYKNVTFLTYSKGRPGGVQKLSRNHKLTFPAARGWGLRPKSRPLGSNDITTLPIRINLFQGFRVKYFFRQSPIQLIQQRLATVCTTSITRELSSQQFTVHTATISCFSKHCFQPKRIETRKLRKLKNISETWKPILFVRLHVGSVLVNDFWTPPAPLVHMTRLVYLFSIIQGQVRLRHFLGRALRLGWARGPSRAESKNRSLGIYPGPFYLISDLKRVQ